MPLSFSAPPSHLPSYCLFLALNLFSISISPSFSLSVSFLLLIFLPIDLFQLSPYNSSIFLLHISLLSFPFIFLHLSPFPRYLLPHLFLPLHLFPPLISQPLILQITLSLFSPSLPLSGSVKYFHRHVRFIIFRHVSYRHSLSIV